MYDSIPLPFHVISKSNEIVVTLKQDSYFSPSSSICRGSRERARISYEAVTTSAYGMTIYCLKFVSQMSSSNKRDIIQSTALTFIGCNGTMDLNARTITSPGYPLSYTPRGLRCTWYIDERPNSNINFSFPNPINTYNYDTWKVRQGCFEPCYFLIGLSSHFLFFSYITRQRRIQIRWCTVFLERFIRCLNWYPRTNQLSSLIPMAASIILVFTRDGEPSGTLCKIKRMAR